MNVPQPEFNHQLLAILQGIEEKSLDSVKFTYTAGMFSDKELELTDTNNPYKLMCYVATYNNSEDILEFLLREVILKQSNMENILFPCAQSIIEQTDRPEMGNILLKVITEYFKTCKDANNFSARCMRGFVQEAAIHENWKFADTMWSMRDKFPIETTHTTAENKHIGKDKEFIPAYVTGSVFHDNVDAMDQAVHLPDCYQEYIDQCLPTWFRMALEGHARKVARYLFPLVKDFILENTEYANCVIKDTFRVGSAELYVQICTMLAERDKKKK
jgi:hypothetical protein